VAKNIRAFVAEKIQRLASLSSPEGYRDRFKNSKIQGFKNSKIQRKSRSCQSCLTIREREVSMNSSNPLR
jgi:hypothetical protein